MLIRSSPPGPYRRFSVWGLALAATVAGSTPSYAQIYSWRDANGNLVLSDQHPAGTQTRSFAVPEADKVRTTRFASAQRSRLYDNLIRENASLHNVRADLVRAVMQVESAFNPLATSRKGALGLMQLMPATIRQFGVRHPFDPAENIRAGVAYLRTLLDRYGNNEELALAAYNAGPGAVDDHGRSVPPYRETRAYVAHVNELASRPIEKRSSRIYKIVESIDGREVVRFTDQKPATGPYEVVGR